MERIVIGYDGSPASVSALAWVAARAARENAAVDVVNVVSRSDKDRAAALDVLGDAEEYLRERVPGLEVELHRLEGGIADELTEFADEADLLVVGVTPGRPIRAAVAGAIPLRLSTRARVPVALVPAGWVEEDEPITVGIADDDSSDAALAFATREARRTGVPLRLVHAWLMPTPAFYGSTALVETPEAVMAAHRAVLDEALTWVLERSSTMSIQTELVRDSRSAALLRYSGRSSMVVIGTHHRGLLAGSILGSVAQEILWHAECPVVVVPNEAGVERYEDIV